MDRLGKNEEALSPVIGTTLMVGMTVAMVAAVAIAVSGFALPDSAPQAKQAKIVIVEAKGGLRYDTPPVNFNENWITLYHKGGDHLNTSKTKIQIKGYGETQDNTYGTLGTNAKGNILVEYTDLEYFGKLEAKPNKNTDPYSPEYHGYEFHNPYLYDGFWSAGERLILNGQDSINSGDSSTVKVYMEGVAKTSNNWRFSTTGQVTITVMDTATNQVIATSKTTVKQA